MRLFNKQISDFQVSLGKSFKKNFPIVQFTKEEIQEFVTQIETHETLFRAQDIDLFEKVNVIKRVLKDKPKLSKTNTTILWKYLKVLYSIAANKKLELQKAPEAGGLEETLASLMQDDTSGFKNLVEDISKQLTSSIGDNANLDKAKIMQDLMAGNLNTGGIDFNSIIQSTSKKLQEGVAKGEINMDNLMKASEQIKKLL